ncbi:MAG: hypothetical protein H0U52_14685 [Chloroflexi bacterium]|nr:hypothetical protein [Chloroflexota bacterium]
MALRDSLAAGLAKPLRLVFRGQPPVITEPTPPDVEEPSPEVEFVAYAEDCILSGQVELAADRLSDLINAHEQLELVDVLVADLTDGHAFEVHELAIRRDEILVVHATGPRGRVDRRQRTRQHPIVAKLGPYTVRGYIHALPGSDPIASLRHRRPMVALTDASLEYFVGREEIRRRVATVLINRQLADWIVEGDDLADDLSRFDPPVAGQGPLTKDFTGDVLGWNRDPVSAVEPDLDESSDALRADAALPEQPPEKAAGAA